MEEIKQKYSTFTVVIVIIFLAMFIVLPPLSRVLYPDENVESNENESTTPTDSGTLVCSRVYEKTNLSITANINFENGQILSNIITFSNTDKITSENEIDTEAGRDEYREFSTLLNTFSKVSEEELDVTKDLNIVTLNNDSSIDKLENKIEIQKHLQDYDKLKSFYESNSYVCANE